MADTQAQTDLVLFHDRIDHNFDRPRPGNILRTFDDTFTKCVLGQFG